jgi:hypothetical protein
MRNRVSLAALPALMAFVIGACGAPPVDDEVYEEQAELAEEQASDAPYAQWDADHSDDMDVSEFDAWWADERDRFDWDIDGEDGLTRDEYVQGVYAAWDANRDGRIDESEWRQGSDRVWGEGRYEAGWTDWDKDGDSELDLNEVREGFETDGIYDRVDGDRDGLIDDEELADWFFDIFDADDNSRIDATEWESTWLNIN